VSPRIKQCDSLLMELSILNHLRDLMFPLESANWLSTSDIVLVANKWAKAESLWTSDDKHLEGLSKRHIISLLSSDKGVDLDWSKQLTKSQKINTWSIRGFSFWMDSNQIHLHLHQNTKLHETARCSSEVLQLR
jgi:hypothetical protein